MSFDSKNQGDVEFERSLVESAHSDAPPHDVRDALARFSGTLSATIPRQSSGGDFSGVHGQSSSTATGTLAKAAGARAVRGAAAKWLLLGAIGGSAVTAAVTVGRPGREANSPVPILDRQAPPSPRAPGAAPVPLPYPVSSAEAAPLSERRTASPATTSKWPFQVRARPIEHRAEAPHDQVVRPSVEDSSTLAAEVSLIDEARTAVMLGEHDEAVHIIERYHRDFPSGALAPDADVVALEAAAAKRDASEVARRAALFLSRYPSDPHAARVRWLAKH